MSKDKIPFCLSSIDLMNSTNVIETSFRNLSSVAAEIQQNKGIYTFSLTMSQIQTLKPTISNPFRNSGLIRNPRNKNAGKLLTLSEFLNISNGYISLLGILIEVENAAYLLEHQGISVVDGIITDFPATTARYRKNQCYSNLDAVPTGVLRSLGNKMLLDPAEAPYPLLVDSDVTEPPLPEVIRSQPPASTPTPTPSKSEEKAIEVPFAFITMAILVSFFISV
ncbi:PREDICTED: glycerophosphodiester phosphodiesterase GDPDL5-like [Camelina sativa]|uniref:glycerophosphodiester phosphodiesterase n=1 Tax=Camelina sativa TaxID=90675 RepID=A0ABM1RB59_CAMSA|nr:PREDICTED: glycerophosphodiester phosphodiesterase GDPDL5-like [Camelina sativa]